MGFENAFFESASGTPEQLPKSDLPEFVFSGRSNVGKSSLINKILNRKSLARVSAKPGKTGTVNFYGLGFCRLVDLPGYGYARVSQQEKLRWAELVEGYFSSGRKIRHVFQIVDVRHEPTADDLQMVDFLRTGGIPFSVVATKSDKLSRTERESRLASLYSRFSGIPVIPFSAVTAEGAEKIRERIVSSV